MTAFQTCQGYSMPCYFKILCHSPCVCNSWKTVRCGGSVNPASQQCDASSLLQLMKATSSAVNASSLSILNKRSQSKGDSALDLEETELESSTTGKCAG